MDTAAPIEEYYNLLENDIGYTFKDKKKIIHALTHSSYANERKNDSLASNERLEFLGDAVLNIIISEKLYKNYPYLPEGEMTKIRANIVCESSLVECSRKLEIGKYLMLGKGEENTGGRNRTSILADAFEALIGAIYIDGGFTRTKEFIIRQMEQLVKNAVEGTVLMDYKTQLQEIVQRTGENRIIYEIIDEKGPDHNKTFVAQAKINDSVKGTGEGSSKKEAEQFAAKAALKVLGE